MVAITDFTIGDGSWQRLEPRRVFQQVARFGQQQDGKLFYEFLADLDHADEMDWPDLKETLEEHFPWLQEHLEEESVAGLQRVCARLLSGEIL